MYYSDIVAALAEHFWATIFRVRWGALWYREGRGVQSKGRRNGADGWCGQDCQADQHA